MTQRLMNLGQWAEQQATELLLLNGYEILQRNFHSRFGEIDIIACQSSKQELVFIEVKARSRRSYASAVETISVTKQKKIMRTALFFLHEYPNFQQFYSRFDVICYDFYQYFSKSIQQDFSKNIYDYQWIENAFTFDSEFINL